MLTLTLNGEPTERFTDLALALATAACRSLTCHQVVKLVDSQTGLVHSFSSGMPTSIDQG